MQRTNVNGMWKSCQGLLFAVSAFFIVDAQAAIWWVDDDNYGNGGTGTESNPFGTIQDALDNPSFTAGDTVNVKAGVYNRGSTINSYGGSGVGNRVVITQKVHIKAVDGRENTFIVGANATTSPNADGQGTDAVRCILYCDQSKYSSGGAIVEGFTICGGRTAEVDNTHGYAAGVFDAGGSGGSRYQMWIVDCTISNCVAGAGGATRFGNLYRCLVTDCKASRRVSGIHGSHAHSCIISHCVEPVTSTKYGLAAQAVAVNSTFFANKTCLAPETGSYRLYSYNCIIAGDGNYEFPYSKTTSTATDGFYQLFAPAVGDYRPLSGSRAATLGDAASLTQINVIDDVKPLINGVRTLVDYAGNPYPSSGTVASGAIQEIAPAPAGGALQFDIDNCTVNGNIAHSGAYVYPETYPTQYVLAATEKIVYCYWRKIGSGTEMVVPRMDDTALLMPPPSVGEVSTNTAQYAVKEYWIDPVTGNDSNNGGVSDPFRTLQKGFDAVRNDGDYRVIHAAAGDYREGGAPMHPDYNNPDGSSGQAVLTNRLCIGTGRKVRFKGAGAGRSFIYGAPDMTTATGLGPAAIRPVCIFSADSIVQGFTMADGYSGNTGVTAYPYRSDDFIVYGRTDSTPAHVADCIVTNCHAARAVTTFVNWQRSLFIDCSSGSADSGGSWINYSGMLESCAFAGVRYSAGSSGLCRNNYSCSFSGNTQDDIPFGNDCDVVACVVDGCKSLRSGSYHKGSVADNVTTAFNYDGVADDVVAFVDAPHGDFRVKSYSGAANCVPAPSADMTFWETYWRHACGDLNGRPLIVFPDGSILAGAVQEMVDASGKVYVRTSRGGLGDGTSAYANGEYDVGGGTLSVSPADGTRPCVGFTVDGVTNLFEGTSWPIAVSAAASGSIVRAIYGTDWYVDDENGNDGNNGFLPSLAKKTLAAALGATGIAFGDTVHAAAGTYADGVMPNGASTQMGSRAIVPQGVTLKGAGADRTVIVGAEATVGVGEYGCGSNAVRCVALERYATVRGFTLTGGHTCCNNLGENAGKTDVNNQGGGVVAVGTERTTTYADRNVIDCVISNNVAGRAGGAGYVTLRRCRVVGNRGTDPTGQASGTFYCRHYASIVENQLAQYGAMYPYAVCESTLKEDGSRWVFYSNDNSPSCEIRNSLFVGKSQIMQPDSVATNSFFTYAPSIASGHDVVGPNSRVISNSAALQFDANLRPVIGANEAIGAGDLSLLGDADKEADCDGGQRVYNDGKLDIGALEADWRPRYAADISSKNIFSVTAASPEVVESAGVVRLPAGATLDAQWSNRGEEKRFYTVQLRLAADSAAAVVLNGETLATCSTAGIHELKFDNALALNSLSFSCTAGTAEILSAEWFKGMTISIR